MAIRAPAALAAALLLSGAATEAASAALVNGSFEQPGDATSNKRALADGDTYVTGWTVNGEGVYYERDNADGFGASNGNYWLGFGHNGSHGASITQSFLTVAGAHYTLNYHFALQQGSDPDSGFRVSASTGDSIDSGDATYLTWASGPALTFTGTGSAVTITVTDITAVASGGTSNVALDNLRLTSDVAATPEPAAWALMIVGFAGAGTLLRHRRTARGA